MGGEIDKYIQENVKSGQPETLTYNVFKKIGEWYLQEYQKNSFKHSNQEKAEKLKNINDSDFILSQGEALGIISNLKKNGGELHNKINSCFELAYGLKIENLQDKNYVSNVSTKIIDFYKNKYKLDNIVKVEDLNELNNILYKYDLIKDKINDLDYDNKKFILTLKVDDISKLSNKITIDNENITYCRVLHKIYYDSLINLENDKYRKKIDCGVDIFSHLNTEDSRKLYNKNIETIEKCNQDYVLLKQVYKSISDDEIKKIIQYPGLISEIYNHLDEKDKFNESINKITRINSNDSNDKTKKLSWILENIDSLNSIFKYYNQHDLLNKNELSLLLRDIYNKKIDTVKVEKICTDLATNNSLSYKNLSAIISSNNIDNYIKLCQKIVVIGKNAINFILENINQTDKIINYIGKLNLNFFDVENKLSKSYFNLLKKLLENESNSEILIKNCNGLKNDGLSEFYHINAFVEDDHNFEKFESGKALFQAIKKDETQQLLKLDKESIVRINSIYTLLKDSNKSIIDKLFKSKLTNLAKNYQWLESSGLKSNYFIELIVGDYNVIDKLKIGEDLFLAVQNDNDKINKLLKLDQTSIDNINSIYTLLKGSDDESVIDKLLNSDLNQLANNYQWLKSNGLKNNSFIQLIFDDSINFDKIKNGKDIFKDIKDDQCENMIDYDSDEITLINQKYNNFKSNTDANFAKHIINIVVGNVSNINYFNDAMGKAEKIYNKLKNYNIKNIKDFECIESVNTKLDEYKEVLDCFFNYGLLDDSIICKSINIDESLKSNIQVIFDKLKSFKLLNHKDTIEKFAEYIKGNNSWKLFFCQIKDSKLDIAELKNLRIFKPEDILLVIENHDRYNKNKSQLNKVSTTIDGVFKQIEKQRKIKTETKDKYKEDVISVSLKHLLESNKTPGQLNKALEGYEKGFLKESDLSKDRSESGKFARRLMRGLTNGLFSLLTVGIGNVVSYFCHKEENRSLTGKLFPFYRATNSQRLVENASKGVLARVTTP
ncbi:hypothetical protein L3V83_11235 [Thiotrichales bacterium 19X7-9]|nr:hypothetical protein [Thiotrichales bacterium 19X7-9]